MAAYNKFSPFVEDLAHGVHDFTLSTGDQLTVCLTNTLPDAGDALLSDLTPVAYTYVSGGASALNITTSSSGQTSGTYDLVLSDLTITASGGDIGPFQYVVVYNSGTAVKTNPLICWFNYGSALTLSTGESLTIDFESDGPSTGSLLTLA